MKKRLSNKIISILLVAAIIITTIIIAPVASLAVSKGTPVELEGANINIWADPENVLTQKDIADFTSGNTLATLGGIKPFKRDTDGTNYYWFLPSNADCSALTMWFEGTASIDGTAITSGTPTDIFSDINEGGIQKSISLNLNGSTYPINVLKSGEVGTVYIDTESGSLSKIYNGKNPNGGADTSVAEKGTIMVVQPNGEVDYHGTLEKMSGRGNGTWDPANIKNPFNIKLPVSKSLLGMESAKKWCLLANAGDNTLVKNQLTYDFSKFIGVKYQPICKPVDLYVNQQYLGSYQLSEKVEIKSNRIDISDAYENLEIANGTTDPESGAIIPADLTGTPVEGGSDNLTGKDSPGHTVGAKRVSSTLKNPTDYTGGYLYELEISQRWPVENAGFCAYNRQGWVIKSADYASSAMINYSYDLLYALGSSVYNGGVVPNTETTTSCPLAVLNFVYGPNKITNPAPAAQYQGKRWNELLDADSAIKYYWTQEFFKNMDSSTSSTYFYKESDSIDTKVYAGPVWDMDNSINFDNSGSESKRWGRSLTSTDDWYTSYSRIYRWRSGDSTKTYASDSYAPLTFYGALSNNCTDFWSGAEKYWYKYISPAIDVLTGKAVDKTGTLKSTAEYLNTIAKSGLMNSVRFNLNNNNYDSQSYINGMNNWFSGRQTWIDGRITKKDINSTTIEPIADQQYTGYPITPQVKVTGLEEGMDYTVSYSNNIEVGTSSALINGFGTYTGSVTKYFNIVPADLASCNVEIQDSAYSNTELNAYVTNSDGRELTKSFTYQWYRDGVAIDNATASTYVTTDNDVNTTITAVVTGNGINLVGSKTSNNCIVADGEKPIGYTQTIASWDYDYTVDNSALITADPTGTEYYYLATGGKNQSSANLYASVNAKDNAKIKWSGTADLYANDSGAITPDQAPIMGTSKSDNLAWGTYPYFEAVVSTAGYEGIKFSAKLGGTKKAPKTWKLQYSLDGKVYTDVSNSYSITNNKTLEQAFKDVALPAECDNQRMVYIRMVVCADIAINGINPIVNQLSGDAAVNNIAVTGSSLSVITSLYAPTVEPGNNTALFDNDFVTITDNNNGADVYYSVNGGEPALYTGVFNPFDAKTAKIGDSVTISAYANFEDITSETTTAVYTFAGVNINSFNYDTYSTDVTNGAVASTGGVYDESGKMTTQTDGKSQYVPLWNDGNGAFCVAPDDGAVWTENSGFTFKTSTAGYQSINFSCMAYTTAQGPKSVTLQYSTDGVTYYNVQSNAALTANAKLEQLFITTQLPAACDNQASLYIRLATTEDMTFGGTTLHNNLSKGNLYVNNIVVGGEDNGSFKMPYTNKSTGYFGDTGLIKYISPDGMPVKYAVVDKNSKIVQNGICPELGIQLSAVKGFNGLEQDEYTVLTWVEEDDDSSAINRATYSYKGETVVKFNYNDSTKLFNDYVSADFKTLTNTSGANNGTLSMYPNATDKAILSYTDTYGVKIAYDSANPFVATKKLDNPNGNGCWLIETSTLGYKGLTLNLEQLSSNNGPRDWGIAYSTDGSKYTYVEDSNVRAISNDASASTVETYGNLPLPAECDNQQKLYIKIFINGGEGVDGDELELATKGNTGINTIEISGIKILSFDVYPIGNPDGFINAKDYAIINKDAKYDSYKKYFAHYITTAE